MPFRIGPVLLGLVVLLIIIGLPGGQDDKREAATPTKEPAATPVAETPETDQGFSSEAPKYTKDELAGIRVGERVALEVGSFPSAGNDLEPVVRKHLKRLKPHVTQDLYSAIDLLWHEGRMWSMQYIVAEVRPSTEVTTSSTRDMIVHVTIRRKWVSEGSEAEPVDTTFKITLVKRGGKWKASRVDPGGG